MHSSRETFSRVFIVWCTDSFTLSSSTAPDTVRPVLHVVSQWARVIDEAFLHVRVDLSRPLWTCPSSPGCKWHRRSEMNDPAAASHRVKTLNAASESVAASPRSAGTCPSFSAWGPSELWPSLRGLARRRRCFSLSPRLSCLPFSGRVSWARPGWRSRRCSPLPACGSLCQTCCRGSKGRPGEILSTSRSTSCGFFVV